MEHIISFGFDSRPFYPQIQFLKCCTLKEHLADYKNRKKKKILLALHE